MSMQMQSLHCFVSRDLMYWDPTTLNISFWYPSRNLNAWFYATHRPKLVTQHCLLLPPTIPTGKRAGSSVRRIVVESQSNDWIDILAVFHQVDMLR